MYVLLIVQYSYFTFDLDVDEQSIEYANENVKRNGLQDRITVLRVDPAGKILPLITDGGDYSSE